MKNTFAFLIFLLSINLYSQSSDTLEFTTAEKDSILLSSLPKVDSVLIDSMLFYNFKDSLAGVSESDSLHLAMTKYIRDNKERKIIGYRLRIYFDNRQDSRSVSENILFSFARKYPNIPITRIYDNPYWRVTVGSFRTKSEAIKFLEEIVGDYPTTFLVRETFSTVPHIKTVSQEIEII